MSAPLFGDTLNKSLNASAFTPSFLRRQEPKTLWAVLPAFAGTTVGYKHPGLRLTQRFLSIAAATGKPGVFALRYNPRSGAEVTDQRGVKLFPGEAVFLGAEDLDCVVGADGSHHYGPLQR